jgi:DNA repair protein RadA/Sms
MAKVKPPFFVRTGGTICKWGQCNSCKEWNTIAEEIIKRRKDSLKSEPTSKSKAQSL